MSGAPAPAACDAAEAAPLRLQARLRTLHEVRTEARLFPDFETRCVRSLRPPRERLHPRGVRDVRTATLRQNDVRATFLKVGRQSPWR